MFTARKIILLLSVALVASLGLQVQASTAIEQAPEHSVIEQAPEHSALSGRVAKMDDIATTDHLGDGDHNDEDHQDEEHEDEEHEDEDHEEHAEYDEASK
jgi:hypothetical protein